MVVVIGLGDIKNKYGSGPLVFENACARAVNIFSLGIFYQSTNIDLVLKDSLCEKMRLNSIISLQHHTRCKLKWKWSPLFIVHSKKYSFYHIQWLYFGVEKGKSGIGKQKKNVPCARQKSCVRGPEPYNFFLPRLTLKFPDDFPDFLDLEDPVVWYEA